MKRARFGVKGELHELSFARTGDVVGLVRVRNPLLGIEPVTDVRPLGQYCVLALAKSSLYFDEVLPVNGVSTYPPLGAFPSGAPEKFTQHRSMRTFRLLYLGNAFPPGVSALFPELQPAGHLIETNLMCSLRNRCEVRSVGISSVDVGRLSACSPASPGLPNALNLLDRRPELWNWWRSLSRLHRRYRQWQTEGWVTDLIVACNFSPVYNAFIRQIARNARRPYLVLYMADSTLLDVQLSRSKRLRYRLKPFKWLDNEMAELYDACVAVSAETETRFRERGIPWLWLPNGVDPARIRSETSVPETEPITFGYFGHAGEHTGIHQLLKLFTASSRAAHLKVCCFGKARVQLAREFARAKNVSFHGPFDPDGCVAFGTTCDVLINPRPRMPENRNNFPSKIFEYGLTGRAILSNQLSGANRILGPHAYYFDADDYDASLNRMLDVLASTPRAELRQHGVKLQRHLLSEYSWETQGSRLAFFLEDCLRQRNALHSRTLESSAVADEPPDEDALLPAATNSSYRVRDLR